MPARFARDVPDDDVPLDDRSGEAGPAPAAIADDDAEIREVNAEVTHLLVTTDFLTDLNAAIHALQRAVTELRGRVDEILRRLPLAPAAPAAPSAAQ